MNTAKRKEVKSTFYTDVLQHHQIRYKTAAEISKIVSTILDLDELMARTVDLIKERFGFAYVGIYLVDEDFKYAKLKAATGKVGKRMVGEGYKLIIGGKSIVGWGIANRKAGIALTEGEVIDSFNGTPIPQACPEMVLPLISHRGVIGVLAVQGSREATFQEQDIIILQSVADHLAVAIENARLHEDSKVEIENRKLVEEALKESIKQIEQAKQEWESTADSLPQVVCLLDQEGNIICANRAIETWGLGKAEEVKGVKFHELFHPGCKNPFCYLSKFWKKAKKRLLEDHTLELEREDEILKRYLSIQARPIINHVERKVQGGPVSFAVVVFQDITERKASEEMWERYEFVVNAFGEAMTLIDKNHLYKAINEIYCEAHNMKRKEIVGKSVAEIWGEEMYQAKIRDHLNACFEGKVEHYQAWFEFPAIGRRFWDVKCYPYRNIDGTVTYIVVVSRDITDRKRDEAKLLKQKLSLQRETEIRSTIGKIATKLSRAKGGELERVLVKVCETTAMLLGGKNVGICLEGELIADSDTVVTLPWRRSSVTGPSKKIRCEGLKEYPTLKAKLLVRSGEISAKILLYGEKGHKFKKRDEELLQIIADTLSLALEVAILEDRSHKLKEITDKVIYMDSEKFQNEGNGLRGRSFKATYLVADTVDSVKQRINQAKLQRLLKSIVIKHGAIWGNSWGDMLHSFFSNHFFKTDEGDLLSAYSAAIEICKVVKQRLGYTMRVGIATGPLTVNKDTIQMDQISRSRIIEKSSMAQEGRVGVTTLQRPNKELREKVLKLGYQFRHSKDIVRGTLQSTWKLYPIPILESRVRAVKTGGLSESPRGRKKDLSFETSLKILLIKGVCGHGHFEGGPINIDIIRILKKVSRLYGRDKDLAQRFFQITGKKYTNILKSLDKIQSWGESRKRFHFEKHFLPWLYIMKLGEASSPELIYELTKAQFKNDLSLHGGVTREICPLVWHEMGLEYDKCIEAFVQGVEDALTGELIVGPISLGVGVKRQFLERRVSGKVNPFVADLEYPYLKSLEVLAALQRSRLSGLIDIFVDTVAVASKNPLFGYRAHPRRGKHTETLYKEAYALGARAHVHLLEELVDPNLIAKGDDRTKELPYVLDLFKRLRIKKGRLIHMTYWPKTLPCLDEIKSAEHEVAVCQTSTRMMGRTHKPASPFLLESREVIEGIVYDESFPNILLSTDDSGPFAIRNVWEEYLVVYSDIVDWHGKELASLALLQFLRNSYNNLSSSEISKTYHFHEKAVRWVMGYDIYKRKSDLVNEGVRHKVQERIDRILKKRQEYLKK